MADLLRSVGIIIGGTISGVAPVVIFMAVRARRDRQMRRQMEAVRTQFDGQDT